CRRSPTSGGGMSRTQRHIPSKAPAWSMPMSDHGHDNEEVRYERRDIRVRPLVKFAAALAVLVVVAHIAMAVLFGWFGERVNRTPESASVINAEIVNELQQQWRREAEVLDNYGWVDREQRLVRIPIE